MKRPEGTEYRVKAEVNRGWVPVDQDGQMTRHGERGKERQRVGRDEEKKGQRGEGRRKDEDIEHAEPIWRQNLLSGH